MVEAFVFVLGVSLPIVLGVVLVLWSLRPRYEPSKWTDEEYLEHVRTCKVHFFHPYLNFLAGREFERRKRG